jgi:hypothetical protein
MIFALLFACVPDDVKDTSSADTSVDSATDSATDSGDSDTQTGGSKQDILGSWLSEGENVCALFQASGFTKIVAGFSKDGTSTATVTDTKGKSYDFTGTYTIDTSTNPGTIEVKVISPVQATSAGIWQIDGDTLTYEVAQVLPDKGFTPPTPDSGFGSTAGPNVEAGVNIQIYVRN